MQTTLSTLDKEKHLASKINMNKIFNSGLYLLEPNISVLHCV